MIKIMRNCKDTMHKMEEIHTQPLILLALLPLLFLLTDMVSGIFLGLSVALVYFLLEGSMLWIGNYLKAAWRKAAYIILLIGLSGIMGILLQLVLFERTGAPFWFFVLEQIASVYILHKLFTAQYKREEAKGNTGEGENTNKVFKEFLIRFEITTKYMIFLVLLGFLRELLEGWIITARLLSGGFLLTAGLLFLWKLTRTMPEEFRRLPRYALSAGLVLLVLAGFSGLI